MRVTDRPDTLYISVNIFSYPELSMDMVSIPTLVGIAFPVLLMIGTLLMLYLTYVGTKEDHAPPTQRGDKGAT